MKKIKLQINCADGRQSIDQVLAKHGLKKTDLRARLLELLQKSKLPLSQRDLLHGLESDPQMVDRVTVYRNLNQLKELGVIHEIDTNKYIYCSHQCQSHGHLLLYCQSCDKHQEVTDHKALDFFFKGMNQFQFLSSQKSVSLRGICESCAEL
jgi:Fe2+ or Zn2+ uptake regulation protein